LVFQASHARFPENLNGSMITSDFKKLIGGADPWWQVKEGFRGESHWDA
jgi:hypothetical protein